MKYYKTTTEFNCGIDLHSRQMYICVMDKEGNILVHRNVRNNDFEYFLKLVEPYRHDLTVCCECTFNWYWLADACIDAGITFILGHAYYLKTIHGGKNKNDKEDSKELAELLRSNRIPPSYVYPKEKRSVRELLRRRMNYVWKRAELKGHLACGPMVQGKQPVNATNKNPDEAEEMFLAVCDDPLLQLSIRCDTFVIKQLKIAIHKLERAIIVHTETEHCKDYNILQTAPGLGQIIALTILYETDDISRFPRVQDFCSYSRVVKGSNQSGEKKHGTRGGKIGNPYLKWAFSEIAICCKRTNPLMRAYAKKLEAKHGKPVANAILASKMARSVYFMLKDQKGFDPKKFVGKK